MVLVHHTHVIAPTDDPLEAVIEGKNYKAYLVANLAFNDSPEGSAEHYGLTLAEVYAAMAFYRDNEESINEKFRELHELDKKLGTRDGAEVLAEIRARQEK